MGGAYSLNMIFSIDKIFRFETRASLSCLPHKENNSIITKQVKFSYHPLRFESDSDEFPESHQNQKHEDQRKVKQGTLLLHLPQKVTPPLIRN